MPKANYGDADSAVRPVDPPKPRKRAINVRLPTDLIAHTDTTARELGCTRTDLIEQGLELRLGSERGAGARIDQHRKVIAAIDAHDGPRHLPNCHCPICKPGAKP